MALSQKRVVGQLASSATALLTVTTGQTWILNGGTVTNGDTSASVADVIFYIYPSGGSAGNATKRLVIKSMLPGEIRYLNLRDHMEAGDVLSAVAGTASKINYHIPYTVRTD
jgi:hypothetical protein